MSPARERLRVGIVGGGIAGVSLAWLLDGTCDVVLLERSCRLGGHAHTVDVAHRGGTYAVDLAAQLFGPKVHPTFVRLLEWLGVYDPRHPDAGGSITREMGTTLIQRGSAHPQFVSPMFGERRLWPLWTRWNQAGQAAFLRFAWSAKKLERSGDWNVSLDDWLRTLHGLTKHQREAILLPWISALSGCSIDVARGFSARAAIGIPARALPRNPLQPYRWSHTRIGLGAVVERLASLCTSLVVHRNAAASGIERAGAGYRIHTADGRCEAVDHLVLAAPPYATRGLLAGLAGCEPVAARLAEFPYFRTRMVIHTDPVYMHADRRMWSAYNAEIDDGYCEASIWYGAIRDRLPDGTTLDIFKSWATARRVEPRELVAEAEYQHPLVSPEFLRAQRALSRFQGQARLWFAGSYCCDVDLQESALRSAMAVARALAPHAPRLGWLEQAPAAP